ncbi:MAG: ORF6N domain-containing protein [Candidatus Margulisbacteria bacterium]|nr:ORF6N domain-containing protein [Candidatus Margulisiibacteriota bacterium]
MNELMPIERIESKIFVIRGQKVMIDRDLAVLYGVSTKRLNEQVKRNIKRFPNDFMFCLLLSEKEQLVANCDRFKSLKHSTSFPYAFTEQGVAMLSSVLNSERAIWVNIAIMRAFVRLRQLISSHKELANRISELEKKYSRHEIEITTVFKMLKKLMEPPVKPTRRIGFLADKEARGNG